MTNIDKKIIILWILVIALLALVIPPITAGGVAKEPFDHSLCQYPTRPTNPPDGCDNSDPADPTEIYEEAPKDAQPTPETPTDAIVEQPTIPEQQAYVGK